MKISWCTTLFTLWKMFCMSESKTVSQRFHLFSLFSVYNYFIVPSVSKLISKVVSTVAQRWRKPTHTICGMCGVKLSHSNNNAIYFHVYSAWRSMDLTDNIASNLSFNDLKDYVYCKFYVCVLFSSSGAINYWTCHCHGCCITNQYKMQAAVNSRTAALYEQGECHLKCYSLLLWTRHFCVRQWSVCTWTAELQEGGNGKIE